MTEQLFHIGIKGLVRNASGCVLLLHMPAQLDRQAYWDLPGGRMEPGESFIETLHRELQEELGIAPTGTPRQVASVLANATIPVGDITASLCLIVYETELPRDAVIRLDPASNEEAFAWFTPKEAAKKLGIKFPAEFCEHIANL